MSTRLTFDRWRPHPWHGLSPGLDPPRRVHAYIEITPFDLVKYEIDKETGYMRADRPQQTSSLPPTLYGFIPRTYCGAGVAALSPHATHGDSDPLDICILAEQPISRAEILLSVRVIGGLRTIDHGAADDKIIAVLENDNLWGNVAEIATVPERLLDRLRHYFATYKGLENDQPAVLVESLYGREHAERVVSAALEDYQDICEGRAA